MKVKEKKQSIDAKYVNFGTDEQMQVWGYTRSIPGTIISWFFILLTLFILRLVFYWKPNWHLACTHKQCSLFDAECILLKDQYDQYFVGVVKHFLNYEKDIIAQYLRQNDDDLTRIDLNGQNTLCTVKYFNVKRWRYIWNEKTEAFEKLRAYEEDAPVNCYETYKGYSVELAAKKRMVSGLNSIHIELTPIIIIALKEVFAPFYVFQIAMCIFWFVELYYIYAILIVLMATISIIYTLYLTRMSEIALRKIVNTKTNTSIVLRPDKNTNEYKFEEISSDLLVPGDIIQIKNTDIMHCDALLMTGNVIVNESMLTGESVPVTKVEFVSTAVVGNQQKLDIKEHARHILYNGTQVLQVKYHENQPLKAVVIRTGFDTVKGELVRSILYPKPVDFRFTNDVNKYVIGLVIFGTIGILIVFLLYGLKDELTVDLILSYGDLISTIFPPILPAALAAETVNAQSRLVRKKIYCISPSTINLCGFLNLFVFDKTGTLTEDGMDVKFVLPKKTGIVEFDSLINKPEELESRPELSEAMACCHSLVFIDGKIAGDPLDIKLFEFTQFDIKESTNEDSAKFNCLVSAVVQPKAEKKENSSSYIGIVKQFPFSSSLQRMSVIVRDVNDSNFVLYTKGSPEKVSEMCRRETVPENFPELLDNYAREGYRVIAIASKTVGNNYETVNKIERDNLERDLEFLGLIIMENRLKPETKPIINLLKDVNVRTVMCTGDNILTGLCVAHFCNMIEEHEFIVLVEAEKNQEPTYKFYEIVNQKITEIENEAMVNPDKLLNFKFHFAMTGKTFGILRTQSYDLLKKLVARGTVFGRMGPDQKKQLVEMLQELKYYVGMCGDGANDCGALKAAHAGISLSEAEASIASPFTSKNANIECVAILMKEGRCALMTAYGVIKYLVVYGIAEFIPAIILYVYDYMMTNWEYLYMDFLVVASLSITFSWVEAYDTLEKKAPYTNLLGFRPLFSIFGHLCIILGFNIFFIYYLEMQPWFEAYEHLDEAINSVSYLGSIYYINVGICCTFHALIFAKGPPFRKPFYTSWPFTLNLIVIIACDIFTILNGIQGFNDFMESRMFLDFRFRVIILAITLIQCFVHYFFEEYFIEADYGLSKYFPQKRQNMLPYQQIQYDINQGVFWSTLMK